MAIINFPSSPNLNDEYTFEEHTWYYNGSAWVLKTLQPAPGASGYSGFSGATGATGADSTVPGPAGASGYSGISGATGAQGIQGVQGTSGYSGIDGAAGSQGASGYSGISGATGAQGVQGVQGTSGYSGIDGAAGSQGASGYSGISGATGAQGVSGYSGINGTSVTLQGSVANFASLPGGATAGDLWITLDTGDGWVSDGAEGWSNVGQIQGPAGPQGTSGYSGINGAQGTSGYSGIDGAAGATGASGYSGVSGATGAQGIQGTSGYSGIDGAAGATGTSGYSGISGATGAQGIQGETGTSGYSGINGATGTSGYSGETGPQGIQGIQGTSGYSGIDGAAGATGTSGYSGISGATGATGDAGATGTSGYSGVSGYSGTSGYSGNPASVATDTIWDAAGDLVVGTGANTGARLALGANNTVLTSNGTTATWVTPSTVSVWDEGVNKTTALTGLNVVGALGTVTNTAGNVTLTLSNDVASTFTTTQTFNGSSTVEAAFFTNAAEKGNIVAAAPLVTQPIYVSSGAVTYFTTNATTNFGANVAWSSGTLFNTAVATGDIVTVVVMAAQGASPFYANVFKIDGTTVTPKWQTGTAPSAGNANSVDSYTYTIVKTGSAAYTVLASQTKFA